MKYLGKKSLSSFLSGLLQVLWYVVLVFSIIAGVVGTIFIIFTLIKDPAVSEIAKDSINIPSNSINLSDWQEFKNIPLALKIIFLPYFGVVVVLLLRIIRNSQNLFKNFKNDLVFNKSNVRIISKLGKLLLVFSILTFNFTSLLISILLLLLCEIFKNGTALQEEYDLTV